LLYNIAAPTGAVFLPGHFAEGTLDDAIVFATEQTAKGMPVKI